MSLLAGSVSAGWSATDSAVALAARAEITVDWLSGEPGGNGGDAKPPLATNATPYSSITAATLAARKIGGPDGGSASG